MHESLLVTSPTSAEKHDFLSRFAVKTWRLSGQNVFAVVYALIIFGMLGFFMFAAADSMKGVVYILMGVYVLVILVLIYSLLETKRKNIDKGVRIERFAKGNGWTYEYETKTLRHPSTVLSAGRDHVFMHVVQGADFQVAECMFITGSGRSERTHRYGYMALTLERALPHMLLDSKSNNMKLFGVEMSNLPIALSKDQVVSLEGDFGKYFTLYAPVDYGTDVRYVFTPDLMHVLIEESDSTDMEIVDDKLFVYFGKHDLADPLFWERVNKLRATLGSKLVERVDRYTDDRTTDGSVAAEGSRLKKSVPVLIIIVLLIYGIQFALEVWSSLQ